MLNKIIIVFICIIPVLTGGIVNADNEIVVCGTGDSQDLLRILAHEFEKHTPGIKVEVPDSIGSSGGVKATSNGDCDIGRIARPLKEREMKYGLTYKLFAYSPVVIVVNQNVKGINNITTQQLIDIYSGKIKNWKDLGVQEGKIYVAGREIGDSARTILDNNIPGFKAIDSPAGQTMYSTPETIAAISRYSGTIGYVPFSMAKKSGITVLKLDGIEPSVQNVQKESYTLVIPLGIVWKPDINNGAMMFIDYLFSSGAHKKMIDIGAYPVKSMIIAKKHEKIN